MGCASQSAVQGQTVNSPQVIQQDDAGGVMSPKADRQAEQQFGQFDEPRGDGANSGNYQGAVTAQTQKKVVEHCMAPETTVEIACGACADPADPRFYGDNQLFVSAPRGAEIDVKTASKKIELVAVQAEAFPLRQPGAVVAQGRGELRFSSPGVLGVAVFAVGAGTARVTVSGGGRPVLSVSELV